MSFENMFSTPQKQTAVEVSQTPNIQETTFQNLIQAPIRSNLLAPKPTIPASLEQIGRNSTDKINKISEQLLSKVKVGDTGSLGKGITDVLSLTATVDMSKIEDEEPGMLGKITNLFKQTKVKVLAQYEDVNQQVGRIATHIQGELKAMEVENKWLEDMYQENIRSVQTLRGDVEQLQVLLNQQVAYVESLKASDDQSMEHAQLVNDEVNIQTRIEKHIDRTERLIQIGIMDAPDIRSMQKNNVETISSFGDIIDVTLPMWKRQLTMALQASRQVKRAELGNSIADRNNELMRKRADMMHDASIKTATLAQRSSVADTDTLEYTQTKLIDRMKQIKQIEENGRAQRAADAQKIAANREQLRLEMKSWGN